MNFSGVKLDIQMPKCVLNVVLTTNQGKYTFDSATKILSWEVGRIDISKLPNIRGPVRLSQICLRFCE